MKNLLERDKLKRLLFSRSEAHTITTKIIHVWHQMETKEQLSNER
jgi:hypothetical protein